MIGCCSCEKAVTQELKQQFFRMSQLSFRLTAGLWLGSLHMDAAQSVFEGIDSGGGPVRQVR